MEGMTITAMLGQSGLLTLLGMCVVFSFIIILICFMKLLQLVVHGLKLDKEETSGTTKSAAPVAPAAVVAPVVTATSAPVASAAPAANNDGAIVAAIAAAMKMRENDN